MRSWKTVASVVLAGALSVPGWSAPPNTPQQSPQQGQQQQYQQSSPQPGMLNYVEGQAAIAGQPVNQNSVGSAQLQAGQSLTTQNGRAELLLTPGVLLRLDGNSAVLMNSPDLADTEATVQGGRAMVEADAILPANHMVIHEGPASIQIMTKGLYDFDAARGQVRVFDGRAEVTVAGKTFTVQGGHEFDLNAAKLKARGFDKTAYEDNFYRWGSLRASYLAEANIDAARGFAQGYYGGPASYYSAGFYGGGYGPGWFWDPYFSAYTWLPGDGIFFSPFGYSPAFVFRAPLYGYGYGYGYHAFNASYRPPAAAVQAAAAQSFAAHGSGFAAAPAAAHVGGGGFAAGGGFHGGGGGGRR
jgi:hypothetical protein